MKLRTDQAVGSTRGHYLLTRCNVGQALPASFLRILSWGTAPRARTTNNTPLSSILFPSHAVHLRRFRATLHADATSLDLECLSCDIVIPIIERSLFKRSPILIHFSQRSS